MKRFVLLAGLGLVSCAWGQGGDGAATAATEKMAASVMQAWPAGVVATTKKPGEWGYEEGVLLDGLAAEWQQTANGKEFAYIKAAVDKYVQADGTIRMGPDGRAFPTDTHTLDDIEMGRAVLLVYRVTQQAKYATAAKFLHEQLEKQPRTASGAYWHKQIYPNQVWLDGAFMAEPFRAEYAATFQLPGEFDDIAKQFLLMDEHMRDPKTGLLRHGWDESKAMPWADKTTGLSPEVWARAMGWYCVGLVDVLDWFPTGHPLRAKLVEALQRNAQNMIRYQDPKTGVWWQMLDRAGEKGNFPEASASAMFTYALEKGVRKGYLSATPFAGAAHRGWSGIQTLFVKTGVDGNVALTGTVKVGGLGGTPYRSGRYDYYIGEPTGENDAKGVGAYLLAGSEMEQADTAGLGRGKTVVVDAWFNSQTRKNVMGQTELFHYKWDDDANSGFSFFGRAFEGYGARLAELTVAPRFKGRPTHRGETAMNGARKVEGLDGAGVYVIASPDIAAKNPMPHFMDKASGDAIEAWVKAGGVLLLMENDKTNSEFEHFNTLSERFGIHFNPVLRNAVEGNKFEMGRLDIPANEVFREPHQAYMKEISTIAVSGPAKAIFSDKGDVLMAVARVGKGVVFACTDPWLYNEYTDGRKLPVAYDSYAAAKDLARWALMEADRAGR